MPGTGLRSGEADIPHHKEYMFGAGKAPELLSPEVLYRQEFLFILFSAVSSSKDDLNSLEMGHRVHPVGYHLSFGVFGLPGGQPC